ncbi:sensor domain-containing diguanylate cyclase [Halomonas huangheensis]|uniref:diguanylate cyclase n=1 Tax=Halomonas huangheensis TaxID=1178482 RepID=W1NCR7_9GAMM|nr:GGDEF domain-containing protein [Halomonas huangheensis]ALM52503.1 hypothetical protein AR456_09605 [Halomonas huangheensis]ERL52996.1 hypothetical protein BJB45_17100 [Halomonas huangheensis]
MTRLVLHVIGTLLLGVLLCGAATASAPEMPLEEGWEYRWGDSPLSADGVPQWSVADDATDLWQPMAGIGNPPGRNQQDNLWMRHRLPVGEWLQPVLFISSLNLIGEAYVDGRLIYRHGQLDEDGSGSFAGWVWHAIELPVDSAGEHLYLRLHSTYKDIGLWGKVAVMEKADVLPMIVADTRGDLAVSALCMVIACLAGLLIIARPQQWRLASIGLFALATGIMVIAESDASQLLLERPLLWDYLAAISYFSLPIAMALMLEHWLPQCRHWLLHSIWVAHLAYAIAAIGLALLGLTSLTMAFPVFDILLLVSLSLIGLILLRYYRTYDTDQWLVIISYAAFAGVLIVDMLVAHGLVNWYSVPVNLGALAFVLVIVLISIRFFARSQQELSHLNTFLEREIDARTKALEAHAERERERASILAVEHHKSQELANLIDRLQGSAALESALHHAMEAMPDILHPLHGAFYRPDPKTGNLILATAWPDHHQAPDRLNPTPPIRYLSASHPRASSRPVNSDPAGSVGNSQHASAAGGSQQQPHWLLPLDIPRANQQFQRLGVLYLLPRETQRWKMAHSDRTLQFIEMGLGRLSLVLSSISLQEELATMSYQDGLTGLHNRRYFDELMAHEAAIALRQNSSLSLAIIDIDHFKLFNDRFGHAAGDAVLRNVSRMLSNSFRDIDVVCRLGGEEFVVLLPGAQAEDAQRRISRMTEALSESAFRYEETPLGTVSVSCGIASYPMNTNDPNTLLTLADQALYRAKAEGRARIKIID